MNRPFGIALLINTILIPFLVLISEVLLRQIIAALVPSEALTTLSFLYLFGMFYLLYQQSFHYFNHYLNLDRRAIKWLGFSHVALFALLYLRLISDSLLSNIVWAVALLGISVMHYMLALRSLKVD